MAVPGLSPDAFGAGNFMSPRRDGDLERARGNGCASPLRRGSGNLASEEPGSMKGGVHFPRSKSAAPERRREADSTSYAGSPATQPKGSDWMCRYHEPVTARAAYCRRDFDPISHEYSPPRQRPQRRMSVPDGACAAAAGQQPVSTRNFPHGNAFLAGGEDMRPAGTQKCLHTDLPPSEELKRLNDRKNFGVQPKTPRAYVKSELPPSLEYKRLNGKAQEVLSKAPRDYAAGAMPPSAELKHMNDKSRLHGAHHPAPQKQIHEKHFRSDDVRQCLVPPRNCPMSSLCGTSRENTRAADNYRTVECVSSTGAPSWANLPPETPREIHSEARSEASLTSYAPSLTLDQRSEASFASTEGGSWVSSLVGTRSRAPQSNGGGRSMYSDATSAMCSRRRSSEIGGYAKFTPAARSARQSTTRETGSVKTHRPSGRISEGTTCVSACSGSSVTQTEPPRSAHSQCSFSFGGFTYNKAAHRGSA